MTRARGSHAVTGCPDKNFLNAILFEIVDSNGQPYIQYSVDYAITIVFIAILISITGKERDHMVTITLTRHSGAADCYIGYHRVHYKIPLTLY